MACNAGRKFSHRCMSELKCYHLTLGKKIPTQTKSLMLPSKVKYKMLLQSFEEDVDQIYQVALTITIFLGDFCRYAGTAFFCPTFFKFQPFASQPVWPALKGEGGIWARAREKGKEPSCVVSGLNSLPLPFRTPDTQAIRIHAICSNIDDRQETERGCVTAVQFILFNLANYSPSIVMELKVSKEITCKCQSQRFETNKHDVS